MKPYWKKKFLTALRSGGYKRGKYRLRSDRGGYCPLGVLCDVVDPDLWSRPSGYSHWYYGADAYAYAFPPPEVLCRVDVKEHDAWLLTAIHDQNQRMTLTKVADYVQANW